ncbi:MAG: PAS domain S-box protein [Cyanobacteria bacterium P01_G01_bin.38]
MVNQIKQNMLNRFTVLPCCSGVLLTVGITLTIELLRQYDVLLPAPFLLILTTIALSASFGGLRAGVCSAGVWAIYLIYAAQVPFGPKTLTGGPFQVVAGISLALLLASLQGHKTDRNKRLTQHLTTIRNTLEQRVKDRTIDLVNINELLRQEISDRIQLEAQLKHRIAFDQLIANISAQFITLNYQAVPPAIDQALKAVGEFTQVDTSYIFLFSTDQTTISLAHEWVAPGYPSQIALVQNVPVTMFPKSLADLLQGEIVHVPDVANVPVELAIDQAGWRKVNLRSVLTVPLVSQTKILGGVGFAFFHGETPWSESDIQLLETFSQILSNAFQRQQAEADLRKSEERWQLAVQNDGIFDVDLRTGETFFSTRWKEMLGYAEHELRNDNTEWWSRIHPDDLAHIIEADWAYRHGQTRYFQEEYRLQCKDGHYKWILGRGHALFDDNGEATRLIGSHTDISDRKQAEADLRQSQQRFQAIFNQTFQFIGLMTPDGTLVEANQTALDFGSLQRADVIDKPFWEAYWWTISPNTQAQLKQAITKAAQGEFIRYDVDVWGAGEQVAPIDFSIKPIRDENGQIVLLLPEGRDISELKRAEAQLRQVNSQLETRVRERTAALRASEQRYRMLYNHTPVMMHSIDRQGRLVSVSDYWLENMGYTRAEVLYHKSTDFLTEASRRYALKVVLPEYFQTGYCREVPYQFVTKTGKIIDVLLSATAEKDASGKVMRSLAVLIDVTERAAIERLKEEFISAVSHELRTPLTALHGALDLLSTGLTPSGSAQGQHVIEIAAQHSHRLVSLVNDILEIERLESGILNLNRTLLKTTELTQQAITLAQMQAERARIHLELSDPSFELVADGDRLMQVLINLLSNGIKFSDPGSSVKLSTQRLATLPAEVASSNTHLPSTNSSPPAATPVILFKVADQGRGIPADKLDQIFERFRQVDASDSRQKGGTGLGLAICRSIVQQHGGQIWVDSELGQGSCFYFTVPQGNVGEVAAPHKKTP